MACSKANFTFTLLYLLTRQGPGAVHRLPSPLYPPLLPLHIPKIYTATEKYFSWWSWDFQDLLASYVYMRQQESTKVYIRLSLRISVWKWMLVFGDSFEASYSKSKAAGFKYDLSSRDTISLQFKFKNYIFDVPRIPEWPIYLVFSENCHKRLLALPWLPVHPSARRNIVALARQIFV